MAIFVTVKDNPAPCEITIRKGRDFQKTFTFKNKDGTAKNLTGYTVFAQARATKKMDSEIIINFTATHNNTGGAVTISTTRNITAAVTKKMGRWDLVLVDPGDFSKTYIEDVILFEDVPTEIG